MNKFTNTYYKKETKMENQSFTLTLLGETLGVIRPLYFISQESRRSVLGYSWYPNTTTLQKYNYPGVDDANEPSVFLGIGTDWSPVNFDDILSPFIKEGFVPKILGGRRSFADLAVFLQSPEAPIPDPFKSPDDPEDYQGILRKGIYIQMSLRKGKGIFLKFGLLRQICSNGLVTGILGKLHYNKRANLNIKTLVDQTFTEYSHIENRIELLFDSKSQIDLVQPDEVITSIFPILGDKSYRKLLEIAEFFGRLEATPLEILNWLQNAKMSPIQRFVILSEADKIISALLKINLIRTGSQSFYSALLPTLQEVETLEVE